MKSKDIKLTKCEEAEKKGDLKRKLEKTDERHSNDEGKIKQKFAEQYFSKKQSTSSFHQKTWTPSPVSAKPVKKEEKEIFCNGVKVIVKPPERKITLEKKSEKASNGNVDKVLSKKASTATEIGVKPSEQVYTRQDGVSFLLDSSALYWFYIVNGGHFEGL